MRRQSYFVTLALPILFIVIFCPLAIAFFDNDVDKAKDFMMAEMYPQATALLEKRINDKPADAEAHYLLGICYVKKRDYKNSVKRFASAVKLDSDYGENIGLEYQKAGIDVLNKGNIREADNIFIKAIEYKPSLKIDIASHYQKKAQRLLSEGNISEAIFMSSRAVEYQPSLKQETANKYFNNGKAFLTRKNSNAADEMFSFAVKHDPSLKDSITSITTAYAKKVLDEAKDKPKKDRKSDIGEARKY